MREPADALAVPPPLDTLYPKGAPFSVEVCPDRPLDAAYLARLGPRLCAVVWRAHTAAEGMAAVRLAGRLRRQGHVVLLHVAGRNLSAARAVEVLEAARGVGVRHLFVVQGDPSSHLERDDAKCDFPYASHLVKFIREKYDRYFVIGVAGYPEKHPQSANMEQDIAHLKKKVACGADFIITQASFSFDAISTFADTCRSEGILVPIVAGVFVAESRAAMHALAASCGVRAPHDLGDHDGDDVDGAPRLARRLLSGEAGGLLVRGFHAFTLNQLGLLDQLLRRLGLPQVRAGRGGDHICNDNYMGDKLPEAEAEN